MYVFTDAETEDVDTGDVDSGNSTSHSPAEDKNSLMLTTSSFAATPPIYLHFEILSWWIIFFSNFETKFHG